MCCSTSANPENLQGRQLQIYNTMKSHYEGNSTEPLHTIISGIAGTRKSYLIHCLRLLLKEQLYVAAPTGVAAFNVQDYTLHSLLRLPTKGEFKELEGNRLHELQQSFHGIRYLIIDKISMVGRKVFGQVDRRLRQAFPHNAHEVLGSCSCLLYGDFGQLPSVMDFLLYTTQTRTDLSDQG